jgi:hypothetical protein
MSYRLYDRGSITGSENYEIFPFSNASRSTLRPTYPPIQRVLGDLTPGVKRLWREAHHSPPSSAEVKNAWSCTPTPSISLHGVVFIRAQEKNLLTLHYQPQIYV